MRKRNVKITVRTTESEKRKIEALAKKTGILSAGRRRENISPTPVRAVRRSGTTNYTKLNF